MKKIVVLFFFLISTSVLASTECINALSQSSIEARFIEMSNLVSFGGNGFLATDIEPTLENTKIAESIKYNNNGKRVSIEFWEENISIVSSEKAAVAHHNRKSKNWPGEDFENPHAFNLYFALNDTGLTKEAEELKQMLVKTEIERTKILSISTVIKTKEKIKRSIKKDLEAAKESQDSNEPLSKRLRLLTVALESMELELNKTYKKLENYNERIMLAVGEMGIYELQKNSTLMARKYVHDEENYWEKLPSSFIDRFSPQEKPAKLLYGNNITGPSFKQVGWTTQDYKAVIYLNRKKGKTAKTQESFIRRQNENGYRYTHKVDLKSVIELARDQKRKGQSLNEGRMNQDFINRFLDMEKTGDAFAYAEVAPLTDSKSIGDDTSEIISDKDRLISGYFGYYLRNNKNQIIGVVLESTFYPTQKDSKEGGSKLGGIIHAKATGRSLLNALKRSGLSFVDAESVSAFTRVSYRGEYIFPHEYDQLLEEQTPIDEILWDE